VVVLTPPPAVFPAAVHSSSLVVAAHHTCRKDQDQFQERFEALARRWARTDRRR
jgi:hypothetical protein